MCKVQKEALIPLERNQAMQHIKAEVCAKKGEIQKFHLHSSSSNEEFLAQDPICNQHIAKNKHNKQTNTTTSKNKCKNNSQTPSV